MFLFSVLLNQLDMISLELWRSRIGGWRGSSTSQCLQSPRKSSVNIVVDLLWRISTSLPAFTILALLIIGGVGLNPGPGSTSDDEISPMEIDNCSQDIFEFPSQPMQHSPISSQAVPLDNLELSSQCSTDVPMTPDKNFSTPRKSRKRKGYEAKKKKDRDNIKRKRMEDADFRKAENECRLQRFNEEYKDPEERAKHNAQQLQAMTERLKDPEERAKHNALQLQAMTDRLKDPEERAKHNAQQLQAMTERLKDPEERAKHNAQQLQAMTERLRDPEERAKHNALQLQAMTERLKDPEERAKHNKRQSDRFADPSIREKHNRTVLEKYTSNRGEVSSVTLEYFSQISQGPTYVCCCCCGCLHFRRSVVILTRTRLDSMSDSTFIDQVCYLNYVHTV